MSDTTTNIILNGKIKLIQPKCGYRVSIDSFILANLIDIYPYQHALDVGCGVGVMSLIMKHKEPTASISAIDIDQSMCDMCRQNATLNNKGINVICGNIEKYSFGINAFDLVITNPPYYNKSNNRISKNKERANFETITLESWLISSLRSLKNGGIFAIIHVASRIDEIMCVLHNRVGSLRIYPIFTKDNIPAKRVVVIGKKGSKSEAQLMPGVVVHNADGTYTEYMQKIFDCRS